MEACPKTLVYNMVSLKETKVQGIHTNTNVQILTYSGPVCQVSGNSPHKTKLFSVDFF